jgi:hypothetical protein
MKVVNVQSFVESTIWKLHYIIFLACLKFCVFEMMRLIEGDINCSFNANPTNVIPNLAPN